MKRILVFSLAYYPVEGGAEIAVKEIVRRIPGIEFDIVTMRFDPTHAAEEKSGNCTIYRINTSKNFYPFKAFAFAAKLRKKNIYDAAWSIMAAYAGLAGLFFKWRFPKVPFILTLQEGDSLEHIAGRMKFARPLFRKVFAKADKVQAISSFLAEWAGNMGFGGKVTVIPNGVNTHVFSHNSMTHPGESLNGGAKQSVKSRAFDTFGARSVVLITTSRLVEKNAVEDIIRALEFLPENVSLKILGTGPLEKSLKLLASSLRLQDRVRFLGHVPYEEIPEHLHEADIFVRPSLSEGFGNSFIEAMAAGLPVVATPVGGIPDFLENEKTGLFCEPGNPESIAAAAKRFIDDGDLRNNIVKNASRMVKERYEWDLVTDRMKAGIFDKV